MKHFLCIKFSDFQEFESIRDEYPEMFAPRKPEDEPQVVPGFESGTIDPNDDEPYDILGDEGKSDKERYQDFLKITRERNFQETEDKIVINIRRLWYDFYMTIYEARKHFSKFLIELLIGQYISKGYRDLLTDIKHEGIIEKIGFEFDGDNCFVGFKLKNQPLVKNGFCEDFITIDKLKSNVEKFNL